MLRGNTLGNYSLTATSSGYRSSIIAVTIGYPPPPPAPAPVETVQEPTPVVNLPVSPVVTIPVPVPPVGEVTPAPTVTEEVQAVADSIQEVIPTVDEEIAPVLNNPWQILGASSVESTPSSLLDQLLAWLHHLLVDILKM